MEQKSNRPVDWEAFVLRYEAKLYRTALAILGSEIQPPKRKKCSG